MSKARVRFFRRLIKMEGLTEGQILSRKLYVLQFIIFPEYLWAVVRLLRVCYYSANWRGYVPIFGKAKFKREYFQQFNNLCE